MPKTTPAVPADAISADVALENTPEEKQYARDVASGMRRNAGPLVKVAGPVLAPLAVASLATPAAPVGALALAGAAALGGAASQGLGDVIEGQPLTSGQVIKRDLGAGLVAGATMGMPAPRAVMNPAANLIRQGLAGAAVGAGATGAYQEFVDGKIQLKDVLLGAAMGTGMGLVRGVAQNADARGRLFEQARKLGFTGKSSDDLAQWVDDTRAARARPVQPTELAPGAPVPQPQPSTSTAPEATAAPAPSTAVVPKPLTPLVPQSPTPSVAPEAPAAAPQTPVPPVAATEPAPAGDAVLAGSAPGTGPGGGQTPETVAPAAPVVNPPASSRAEITAQRKEVAKWKAQADRMAETDPEHAAQFQAKADEAQAKLADLVARKTVGTAPQVGLAPDGSRDLLSDIADYVGKIATKAPAGASAKGGEYDGVAAALGSGEARWLRGGESGTPTDKAIEILNANGYKFQSTAEFNEAVIQAGANRGKLREAQATQKYQQGVEGAALGNVGRPAALKAPASVPVEELGVGAEFEIKGEKFHIVDVDSTSDDPAGDIYTIKDGHKFTVPAGTPLYPDKGKFTAPKVGEVSLPEANGPLGQQEIAGSENAFNLASTEAPDPAKALASVEARRAADEAQGKLFAGEVFTPTPLPANLVAPDAAMNAASQEFLKAQAAYRARQIGDPEFLAAKAKFDAASHAYDIARGEAAPGGLETHGMGAGGGSGSRAAVAPQPRPSTSTPPQAAPSPGPIATPPPRAAVAPAQPRAPLAPAPGALTRDLQRLQATVAPQTAGDAARFTANLLRELSSKMANELARADAALRPFRNGFDSTRVLDDYKYDPQAPLPRNYAVINAIEQNDLTGIAPRDQEFAALWAKQNASWIDRIHAAAPDALKTWYANWFVHLWKDPVKAQSVLGALLAKNPLEGSKAFLKQRTHKLMIDGLAAGLVPVHDNPVDLILLKQREVERFILGRNFVTEMKGAGLLPFVHAFQKAPEGYATVPDRAFTVFGPPTVTIKEAFDAGMRAATLDALAKLGVPHERLAKIGGQRWGYEQNQPRRPGTERIVTKFGGPDFVIWHELGHALDSRYPEMRAALFGGNPSEVGSARAARNFKRQIKPEQQDILIRDDELRALADARGGEGKQVSESYTKYLHKTTEKMAVVLQAYLHAPDLMQAKAPTIKAAFAQWLRTHPELSMIDEIRPTLELGSGETQMDVGGQVKLGNYYMPDAAARVMNNFLSPGLNPHLWYRSLREVSNIVNSAQLSLSAFHLGFTSLDAAVSNMQVSISDAVRGNFGLAAKTAAGVPLAPITNIIRGARLRAAVLANAGAGDIPHPLELMVRALEAGGGRVGQDAFWETQFTRRMMRGIAATRQQLSSGQWLGGSLSGTGALMQAPFALLEQTMRPILSYVVPRQKLGVFALMASRELARLGPDASPEAVREAMGRVWNSVDNRMGQLVYDNLMMNRVAKDVALLSFRAFGWQLGKYREGVGAFADTADALNQLRSGVRKTEPGTQGQVKKPLFTDRMGYVLALGITVGVIGGVIHYLMTGRRPKGRDYYQPQTGDTDRNGNPERVNPPSYLKDAMAYSKAPFTSFAHSLNPMLASTFDLLRNKDFYDVQIRNPDDPLWKQGSDVAKWAGSELTPFSLTGAAQLHALNTPAWKQVAPFFGVTPVPARQTMTPAQTLAGEMMSAGMPSTPQTRHQFEAGKLLKDVVQQMKTGDRAGGMKAFTDGIDRGALNPNSAALLVQRLGYTPLQFQVHHLEAGAAMKVWRVANDAERKELKGIISVKILNSQTIAPGDKSAWLREIQTAAPTP